MADFYALEYVGGPDGTSIPAKRLDGRLVGNKHRSNRAVKRPSDTLNVGDQLYIGQLPIGATVASIIGNSDTSLGTTTLSVGTKAAPTKYVNARTLSAVDTPTPIGPRATAADDAPSTVIEDLWLTVGVAAIPAAVLLTLHTEYKISA